MPLNSNARVESFREDENSLIVIEELVQGRTLEQILRIREHASSLDTRLEKVIPGFDPHRKKHRLLVRAVAAALCAVILLGGPPDASTRIRLETIDNVTGGRSDWTSPEACSRGSFVDASYNVNTFEFSIFEREHTVNAYSEDGKMIGSWTGVFTKDFTMD